MDAMDALSAFGEADRRFSSFLACFLGDSDSFCFIFFPLLCFPASPHCPREDGTASLSARRCSLAERPDAEGEREEEGEREGEEREREAEEEEEKEGHTAV